MWMCPVDVTSDVRWQLNGDWKPALLSYDAKLDELWVQFAIHNLQLLNIFFLHLENTNEEPNQVTRIKKEK